MNWGKVVASLNDNSASAVKEAEAAAGDQAKQLTLLTVAAILLSLSEAIEAGQEPKEEL